MTNGDIIRTLNDLQLLKFKINNTLLMCNVIMDDLETIKAINDRTCTYGTTTTKNGDNYD